MTISIWRYSHLALAVSSFVFIVLASVTGFILAFEPVSDSLKPYAINNLDQITLAETLSRANDNFDEIIELKVEKGKFVIADGIDNEGESVQVYIDPNTGKSLGKIEEANEFFQFVTTLHRSLFLHGLGRFFVGLTAFLLFLIAFTGSILVVKRQRGLRKFFSKVVRENGFQFYHVIFGRLWLVPILIISVTGVFLTLNEFELFEKPKVEHKIDNGQIENQPKKKVSEFPAFKNLPLSKIVSVEFPFSDDPEDAFTIKLTDGEIVVNQFTGTILSDQKSGTVESLVDLGLDLHTGRASLIWAMVLAIASINILFFVYSGFAMTFKRRSGKITNKFKKEEAEFIVLAGSENGSTMGFAKSFHRALVKSGQKSFFGQLNDYQKFDSAKHIIAISATYGNGEPPSNAKKALALIGNHAQNHAVNFSVIGFGSHAYPDFCQFAYDLYNTMSAEENLTPFLEIRTVNDKAIVSFTDWVSEWSNKVGLKLDVNLKSVSQKPKKLKKFVVTQKTEAPVDGAFIVKLVPKKGNGFASGDLINVYPANDHRERQYSIGKIGNAIQLSVKRLEFGLGSDYLYNLKIGQTLYARIVQNETFHFNRKAKQSILISNGTGIAPFLGMIDENESLLECHLYCGFKNPNSFEPYKNFVESRLQSKKLTQLHLAYSRQGDKQYVKDILEKDSDFVATVLQNGGQVMLCGSLEMQNNVLELLSQICNSRLKQPLSHFQSVGQIKMDCY